MLHEAVLDWRVADQRFFTFELPLAAIEANVPAPLSPVELRPEIGLASLGWLRFAEGNFGAGSPGFDELFVAIHVHADLALAMPQPPKVALLVVRMWTTSPELVRADEEHVHARCALEPSLAATIDGDAVTITARDAPIARLVAPVAPIESTAFWGQLFTTVGGIWRGAWHWEGARSDQMQPRNASRLSTHSFFDGLAVDSARPYRQMVKGPGIARERFFTMRDAR